MFMAGVCLSLAQEKRTDESSAIIADTVINNGWVVAYGQLLKKPYAITLRNDTIYINDIQIAPPLPDPASTKIKPLQKTKLGEQFLNAKRPFQTRCGELYAEWFNKYGEAKAGEMITTLLDTQQVVEIKEYKLQGDFLTIVYDYKWSDIYEEVTPMIEDTYYDEYVNLGSWVFASKDRRTEEEKEAFFSQFQQKETEQIREGLKSGALLVFDYSGNVFIHPDRAKSVINDVREVLHTELSNSVKVAKIVDLLILIPTSALEVIKNSNSWKVENEK